MRSLAATASRAVKHASLPELVRSSKEPALLSIFPFRYAIAANAATVRRTDNWLLACRGVPRSERECQIVRPPLASQAQRAQREAS